MTNQLYDTRSTLIKGESTVTVNITIHNRQLYRDHGYLICKHYLAAFSKHFDLSSKQVCSFLSFNTISIGKYYNGKKRCYSEKGHASTSYLDISIFSIKSIAFACVPLKMIWNTQERPTSLD